MGRAIADATPPTNSAVRHHRHQHEDRKHERNAGECIVTEEADEIRFSNAHQRLNREHDQDWKRQADEARRDRSLQQCVATGESHVTDAEDRRHIALDPRDRLVIRQR